MNFLVGESLHTSLVDVAVERGHDATHVNYRGLSGVQDWNLMAPIGEGVFTFVANNAKGFRRLYAREDRRLLAPPRKVAARRLNVANLFPT